MISLVSNCERKGAQNQESVSAYVGQTHLLAMSFDQDSDQDVLRRLRKYLLCRGRDLIPSVYKIKQRVSVKYQLEILLLRISESLFL